MVPIMDHQTFPVIIRIGDPDGPDATTNTRIRAGVDLLFAGFFRRHRGPDLSGDVSHPSPEGSSELSRGL